MVMAFLDSNIGLISFFRRVNSNYLCILTILQMHFLKEDKFQQNTKKFQHTGEYVKIKDED